MTTTTDLPTSTTPSPAPRPPWFKRPLTWAVIGLTVLALTGTGLAVYAITTNHTAATPKAAATAPAKPAPKAAAPKHAAPPTPKHQAAPAQPAPAAAVSKYAQDILNAGITAPASWIDKTGRTLVADWQAGHTAAWTDANVLGPGGVYPSHYAIFDQITEQDFGVHPAAAGPVPPAPAPQYTNAVAVVQQYYQDITDHNYAAAWALGGDNLNNGTGYDKWVAGYNTTASIDVTASGTWSDGTVWCNISALQTSGAVYTYYGTYTVSNGVIVSADIQQTS